MYSLQAITKAGKDMGKTDAPPPLMPIIPRRAAKRKPKRGGTEKMSYQVTKKQVVNEYRTIVQVGYCGAQFLLRGLQREAYTVGVYGWNADVYDLGQGIALVTGYRPFGSSDYTDLVDDLNKEAQNADANRIALLRRILVYVVQQVEYLKDTGFDEDRAKAREWLTAKAYNLVELSAFAK